MRKMVLVTMCVLALALNMVVCGSVLAGALENASEFQNEIVEKEEQQSENKEAAGSGPVTWQDAGDSDNADSGDQAGQQPQQQDQQ